MANETIDTTAESSLVRLDSITALPAWQVRSKINEKVASQYADALRRASEFPPIQLARIDGKLYLIDGWHRVRAHRLAGVTEIWADITVMDFDAAKREAALANIAHGVPLKRSERRQAFRLFVKGGGHRKKRGKGYLSYREIAAALYGMASYTAIRDWMRKDFNSVFRAMGDDMSIAGTRDRETKILTLQEELAMQAANLTQQLKSTLEAVPKESRLEFAKELEDAFRKIGMGWVIDHFVSDPNDIEDAAF